MLLLLMKTNTLMLRQSGPLCLKKLLILPLLLSLLQQSRKTGFILGVRERPWLLLLLQRECTLLNLRNLLLLLLLLLP